MYSFLLDILTRDEQRALILVSKMIQQLANGKLFGDKEEFMTILNPFLEQTATPLREFFEELVVSVALVPSQSRLVNNIMGNRLFIKAVPPEDKWKGSVIDKTRLSENEVDEMKMILHQLLHEKLPEFEKHVLSLATEGDETVQQQLRKVKHCLLQLGAPTTIVSSQSRAPFYFSSLDELVVHLNQTDRTAKQQRRETARTSKAEVAKKRIEDWYSQLGRGSKSPGKLFPLPPPLS